MYRQKCRVLYQRGRSFANFTRRRVAAESRGVAYSYVYVCIFMNFHVYIRVFLHVYRR